MTGSLAFRTTAEGARQGGHLRALAGPFIGRHESRTATAYDLVRSNTPDFSSGCALFSTSQPFLVDPAAPHLGHIYYYLVRPAAPHVGSWGQNSDGTPRSMSCLGAGAGDKQLP